MNIFLNGKAKKGLSRYNMEEDEFMKEAVKDIIYDESGMKHNIILLLDIGGKNYGAIYYLLLWFLLVA